MSTLGQKQTSALQKGMSALLPKADMCGATSDVRFGPIADIVPDRITGRSAGFRPVNDLVTIRVERQTHNI
jgi:hypothetical protein